MLRTATGLWTVGSSSVRELAALLSYHQQVRSLSQTKTSKLQAVRSFNNTEALGWSIGCPPDKQKKQKSITGLAGRSCFRDYSGVQTGEERGRGGSMSTDEEPTYTVKLLQLLMLSTYWGMQIWVTFISSFVMDNHLNRHTYGFIQSRLVPFYLHLGSACAFFNLTIYAVYHPCDMLDERESFQIFIFFVSVTVAAVNAQWFGQMTSEIMADMHLVEQACGLGQDIGQSSNREAYAKLCETDVKYRHLSGRLWLYRLLSSLCNLCCIGCNFHSLCYMAENLAKL